MTSIMFFSTSSFLFLRLWDASSLQWSLKVFFFTCRMLTLSFSRNYFLIIIQNIPVSIFQSFWRQFLNLRRRCRWRKRRETGFSILMNAQGVCRGSIYKPFDSHLGPVIIRGADVDGGTAPGAVYRRFTRLVIKRIHLYAMNQLVGNEKFKCIN